MNRISIIPLLILLFGLTGCEKSKQQLPENRKLDNQNKIIVKEQKKRNPDTKRYGVVTVNGLRLRASNDIHAKIYRNLNQGMIVEVLKLDENRVRINELEDYWYYIEYEGIKGWAFGYYLEIYSNREDAVMAARRYIKTENPVLFNETDKLSINKNLFFISKGQLLQVYEYQSGKAKILVTEKNISIVKYFFSEHENRIYYIGVNQSKPFSVSALFSYHIITKKNSLLIKNVYDCAFDFANSSALVLGLSKNLKKEYWFIRSFDLNSLTSVKVISQIEKNRQNAQESPDLLSLTITREFGNLIHFEWDKVRNFVYFKPPEANKTYLVSVSTGEYIQIDMEKSKITKIDENRYIEIISTIDEDNKPQYSIYFKDRISGTEKEIVKSSLYPLNFVLSPKKNCLALSMLSMHDKVSLSPETQSMYYPSSIYVLSLTDYSFIPISTDGQSYQPGWSYISLR